MEVFVDVGAHATFASEKMKKNNLFTTERLFCDVYCFEPGQEQTAHAHAGSDKVYYVIEGAASIRVGDQERGVSAGTAALAPAGVPHAVRAGAGRLKLLVLMAPKP
jgi:quercetin dioxygenase-like cupin family protein